MIDVKEIVVNSDEMLEEAFAGTLYEFAAAKLSEWHLFEKPNAKIISIESHIWNDEMRPKQNNSSTWYTRQSLKLRAWYTVEL